MQYGKNDFLETADPESMEQIRNARKLTREYYLTDQEAPKNGAPF